MSKPDAKSLIYYNQKPVRSVLAAFQANNSQGSPLLTATELTNASVYATTNFTLTEKNYSSSPPQWE
jgi:hypothetical protein